MRNFQTTDKDLVEILEARNTNGKYDDLISNCKNFRYHDFKAEHPTPKKLLYMHLEAFPELYDLKQAVMRGQFDEPADYNDVIAMRNALLRNNTPEYVIKNLGLSIDDIKKRFPEESQNL
jgi:hypothetical protein